MCGGTWCTPIFRRPAQGLSPRVRGNRIPGARGVVRFRSIPACAGEPPAPSRRRCSPPVYPRVCGGTGPLRRLSASATSLSPRVRGNRAALPAGPAHRRSIPACAGEPPPARPGPGSGEVYPRVCGGTDSQAAAAFAHRGLSPRVRGNPFPTATEEEEPRSIPACAGEPSSSSRFRPAMKVYPRVCGGTACANRQSRPILGLSPRVRGNLLVFPPVGHAVGSIPACAGEPSPPAICRRILSVYPRVCGGTLTSWASRRLVQGLSPRVRGNHQQGFLRAAKAGSIPACAGEPQPPCGTPAGIAVYPRVCGGTLVAAFPSHQAAGLSPRVRGNPPLPGGWRCTRWSIPACAGEPLSPCQ